MVYMKKMLFLLLITLCSFSGIVYSDISWSGPSPISTALTDASNPQVVIDSAGNATAVWIESGIIKASTLPSGGSWSAPVSISNVSNTSSNPKLGVDSSGNVTALWIEVQSGSAVIESATLPFGGSWGAETSPISGAGASKPSLAVDSSGNAVAVWVRNNFVETSTRQSGTWSNVSMISATSSDNPHVAISSFGTAQAAWRTTTANGDVIVTSILTVNTNTWGTNKNVFPAFAAFHHDFPKIALDSNGNANIGWFRYNTVDGDAYENVQVLAATLTQGASNWGGAQAVSNSGIRNPADLTIKHKMDTNGDSLLVWINSYDGQTFTVEASQRLFGSSTWGSLIGFTPPSIYSLGLDLATAAGIALVTNMQWDGSSINIAAQEADISNPVSLNWTINTTISTGSDNGFPKCAMAYVVNTLPNPPTLNAVAVWLHFDGTNQVIHASTGTGAVVVPPSNVLVTQSNTNFGVYTDYQNTITWSASTDPGLVQYNIFRNGVFFASTDTSTLTFTDHNAAQSGTGNPVIYGVAAMTSSFFQSNIITFTLN